MPSTAPPEDKLTFERPWFPGLAERLVGPALERRGFKYDNYGTRRWTDQDPQAPRLGLDLPEKIGPLPRVEILSSEFRSKYEALGLCFTAVPDSSARQLLRDAWACLTTVVPDAAAAVSALVWAIHLLEASGPGYDVSHSDPDLPCSVFLSLPAGEPHAGLRAAESLLHEAMHLQLTLLEAEWPIVRPEGRGALYSPWQRRLRPVSGLVHGLYVFVAIDVFLADLSEAEGLAKAERSFAAKRRREIAAEVATMSGLTGHDDLTPFGQEFVETLLRVFENRPKESRGSVRTG